VQDLTSGKSALFPAAEFFKDSIPAHNRWFVRRMREARGDQLLSIVRILDKAMNNTSVILLFEAGDKKLLFPGDAQIEEYALSDPEAVKLLRSVDLYKVGHHGSRNATPKSLWNLLDNRKIRTNGQPKSMKARVPERLKSLISTLEGKHGDEARKTEVPRKTLVQELEKYSDYHTTQTAAKTRKLFIDLSLTL
jgi:hypothetical protein